MKPSKSEPTIVLFPPSISVNKLSNKYELILDVRWGTETKQVAINRELGNFTFVLTTKLNETLADLSETKPYIIQ